VATGSEHTTLAAARRPPRHDLRGVCAPRVALPSAAAEAPSPASSYSHAPAALGASEPVRHAACCQHGTDGRVVGMLSGGAGALGSPVTTASCDPPVAVAAIGAYLWVTPRQGQSVRGPPVPGCAWPCAPVSPGAFSFGVRGMGLRSLVFASRPPPRRRHLCPWPGRHAWLPSHTDLRTSRAREAWCLAVTLGPLTLGLRCTRRRRRTDHKAGLAPLRLASEGQVNGSPRPWWQRPPLVRSQGSQAGRVYGMVRGDACPLSSSVSGRTEAA